jgi:tRNA G26 N,N-dimethylase Trm1
VAALKEKTGMLVQETIQPLLRFFNANVTTDTDTSVVSISNTQAVRIVAHTGTVSGTNSLRVFVNTTNSASGATELTDKAIATLASNSSYEIFVSGAEAYAAMAHAAFLFVQVDVGGASPSVPIAIEISAFPARDVPASLPSGWTRVL